MFILCLHLLRNLHLIPLILNTYLTSLPNLNRMLKYFALNLVHMIAMEIIRFFNLLAGICDVIIYEFGVFRLDGYVYFKGLPNENTY